MYDCENIELNYDKLITITNTVIVTGDKGTQFSFIKWRQYMMCGCIQEDMIPCKDCPNRINGAPYLNLDPGQVVQNDYIVCVDKEKFLIPSQNACIEGYLRPIEQQDFIKWKERFWTGLQPKDYKEAAFYLFGRFINTGHEDIANQKEYDRIKGTEKSHDGQYFGRTAKEPEDDNY